MILIIESTLLISLLNWLLCLLIMGLGIGACIILYKAATKPVKSCEPLKDDKFFYQAIGIIIWRAAKDLGIGMAISKYDS